MTSDSLEQHILSSIMSADFMKFIELVSNDSGHFLNWNKIYLRKSGDTPVHLAANSGCVEVIKYFNENGYEMLLQQRNFDGKTPLHVAAQFGQLSCVKYLLFCGVPVDVLKRADWTPLMLACTKNDVLIIQELLSYGANPWCRNKDGWTAFHIASREGHIDVVSLLLDLNPSLCNTTSKNGRTPLHTASLHGHLQVVKKIVNYNSCNKDVQDSCGTTPLMDAVSGNHLSVVEYLLKVAKADVTKKDALGRSTLHLAAQSCSLDCLLFLIHEFEIDINQKTKDGLTALHFAVKEDKMECVKLLLQLGADILIKDNRGRLAKEYSTNKQIINIL